MQYICVYLHHPGILGRLCVLKAYWAFEEKVDRIKYSRTALEISSHIILCVLKTIFLQVGLWTWTLFFYRLQDYITLPAQAMHCFFREIPQNDHIFAVFDSPHSMGNSMTSVCAPHATCLVNRLRYMHVNIPWSLSGACWEHFFDSLNHA